MPDIDPDSLSPASPLRRARFLLEYLVVAGAGSAIRLFPRRAVLAFGSLIGAASYYLRPGDRAVAMANLDLVLGDAAGHRRKRRIARGTFRRIGRVVLGLFWAPRLTPTMLADLVDGSAFWAVLRDLQSRGRGAILVTVHYGDWELLCHATAAAGFPMMMVTEPLANARLDALFDRLRTCTGNRTVPPKHAVLKLFRGLRRGDRAAMMADVNGRRGRGGAWVELFGRQVFNGSAIAELAIRTDSSIVFAAMRPIAKGRHRVVCYPPIDATPGDADLAGEAHDEAVRRLTQRVVDCHADLLRADPEPWLWTYKRWKRRPTADAAGYPFYSKFARVK